MRLHRCVAVAASALAPLALLAACAGPSSPTASTGSAVKGSSGPATVELNRTVWFGGRKFTFTRAVSRAGGSGQAEVQVDANVVDEATDQEYLTDGAAFDLACGKHYEPDSGGASFPRTAAWPVRLVFTVATDCALDGAVLTIGGPSEQQAVVPFGGGGQLVDRAPVALPAAGSATANGKLTVALRAAELRADRGGHQAMERGQLALRATFDVGLTAAGPREELLSGTDFTLKRPDGSVVAALNMTPTSSILRAGTTVPKQVVWFPVTDPAAGEYTLVVTASWETPNPIVTFPVTIKPAD